MPKRSAKKWKDKLRNWKALLRCAFFCAKSQNTVLSCDELCAFWTKNDQEFVSTKDLNGQLFTSRRCEKHGRRREIRESD